MGSLLEMVYVAVFKDSDMASIADVSVHALPKRLHLSRICNIAAQRAKLGGRYLSDDLAHLRDGLRR